MNQENKETWTYGDKQVTYEQRQKDEQSMPGIHELFNEDPGCAHNIVSSRGGGIKCTKCSAWFCF